MKPKAARENQSEEEGKENDAENRKRKRKEKAFCKASQAAIALHSWAAEISHKADACISSVFLSCHISNRWLTALICWAQGCMFANALYSLPICSCQCVSVWMFVGLVGGWDKGKCLSEGHGLVITFAQPLRQEQSRRHWSRLAQWPQEPFEMLVETDQWSTSEFND